MGTGYQEEKKEQYEKMMEEIAGHPDFGKKNPIDIGVECGYQEESIMEMICYLQGIKNGQYANEAPDTVTAIVDENQGEQQKKSSERVSTRQNTLEFNLFTRKVNIPLEEITMS